MYLESLRACTFVAQYGSPFKCSHSATCLPRMVSHFISHLLRNVCYYVCAPPPPPLSDLCANVCLCGQIKKRARLVWTLNFWARIYAAFTCRHLNGWWECVCVFIRFNVNASVTFAHNMYRRRATRVWLFYVCDYHIITISRNVSYKRG